jgi:hypothetical protein
LVGVRKEKAVVGFGGSALSSVAGPLKGGAEGFAGKPEVELANEKVDPGTAGG